MTPCLSEENLQAYLDGEQAADNGSGVIAHLAGCADCAARAGEAEQALAALGRAFDEELPAIIPTARLHARIESALAERATPRFTVAPLLVSARHWSGWKLAAVAAGILILISTLAIFWQPSSPLKPKREGLAVFPTPISTPAPQATPPKLAGPPVGPEQVVAQRPENRPKRARRQTSRDDLDEVEVVTQFFPLREGEDLTALESVRLVRIELPGSAFSEVGLLVDQETANAPVKADVVLGQDGLARAIRFVR